MKIPNKRELQQLALNQSSDINFQDFMHESLYKNTAKPCSFLVIDTILLHQIILQILERTF